MGIEAFIPDTDPEYQKHKKILLMCAEAQVSLPRETAIYFNANKERDAVADLLEEKLRISLKEDEHYTEYQDETSEGFEVDITKLPPGVTKLRFTNSW